MANGRVEATAAEAKHFFQHGNAGRSRIADESGQLPLLCGVEPRVCEIHGVEMHMHLERKHYKRKLVPDRVNERYRWVCPCCEALRKTDVDALIKSVKAGTFTGRLGKWQRHVIPADLLAEYDLLMEKRAKARAEKTRLMGANYRFKRKYGITLEERDRMVAAQDGRCAICDARDRELVVDHCHTTGKVRQMLCTPCNSGLGLYGEDKGRLLRAVEYLAAHAS